MNKPELPGRYARMNDIILETYGQACIEYDRAQGRAELIASIPDKVYLPNDSDMTRWRAIGWNACRDSLKEPK